jgi:hypothetical protein
LRTSVRSIFRTCRGFIFKSAAVLFTDGGNVHLLSEFISAACFGAVFGSIFIRGTSSPHGITPRISQRIHLVLEREFNQLQCSSCQLNERLALDPIPKGQIAMFSWKNEDTSRSRDRGGSIGRRMLSAASA